MSKTAVQKHRFPSQFEATTSFREGGAWASPRPSFPSYVLFPWPNRKHVKCYNYPLADLGERFWKENDIKHAENKRQTPDFALVLDCNERWKQSGSELSKPEWFFVSSPLCVSCALEDDNSRRSFLRKPIIATRNCDKNTSNQKLANYTSQLNENSSNWQLVRYAVTSLRSDVIEASRFICITIYGVTDLWSIFRTQHNVSDMFGGTNFEFSLHGGYGNSVFCGDEIVAYIL